MLLSNPYNPDDRVRNEALALMEIGCAVTILAWDRNGTWPANEWLSGIEVKRVMVSAGYELGLKKILRYFRVWQWFINELDKMRPDVVHCHDYDTYLAGVWYALFHPHTRLVLDTHENYYMMMKPLVSNKVVFSIGLMERILTHFAHLLISSNQATADYYNNFGARGTTVISNWKDPKVYEFEIDVITKKNQELAIKDNQLVIVYIGALSADRNILPLLQAIRGRSDVFLILGGRGDQEGEIRSVCLEMNNVYFPGYVHPDEVPLFTALADVVYYCYDPDHIYAPYNAPNKLYEALAAGKALLASDLGGELSNVVRSVQCGVLLSQVDHVTISNAIDLLLQKPVRLAMQAASRDAGQTTYNWTIARDKLKLAYTALLSEIR
jgi:glycosyltransferase involved in cell wall biosynthesis